MLSDFLVHVPAPPGVFLPGTCKGHLKFWLKRKGVWMREMWTTHKDDLSSSSGQGRAQVRSRKPASGSIVLLRLERAFDLQILCVPSWALQRALSMRCQ